MASTPSIVLDLGDGKDSLQPLAEFGVTVLTQAPVSVRPDGPDQPIAAHLGDFATELDGARSVPGLWLYPGNGNGGAALSPNQTVFPVPGGYTPGFVKVRIGPFYIDAFTAADGTNVVITGYTFVSGDVVQIEVLKAGAIANAASKAELAGKASIGHTAAPDANYQALATDTQIGFAVLTAARTVFLSDVDLYPIGQVLFIADESGQCSVDRPIIITVGAGTNDTIAGQASEQLTNAYQGLGLRRGAANVWIIAR